MTAPSTSERINTRRRSKRSPSAPPNGSEMPAPAKVATMARETHVVESVRSYTAKISAMNAAWVPTSEISRENARRRTAGRGLVV